MAEEYYSVIQSGRKTVTTHGTAEELATNGPCRKITIVALITNTDYVCVGGSDVIAAESTRNGLPLVAGQSIDLVGINNLKNVYVDSVIDEEGITFVYYN
jgi:hypothetical protein